MNSKHGFSAFNRFILFFYPIGFIPTQTSAAFRKADAWEQHYIQQWYFYFLEPWHP